MESVDKSKLKGVRKVNSNKLKGAIRERYSSVSALAEEIGMSRGGLNLAVNGKRTMSLELVEKLILALHLNEREANDIFFDSKLPKVN